MKKLAIAMGLLMAVAAAPAFAQGGGVGGGSSAGASSSGRSQEAPIGHRQVRPSDIPSEKNISDPNNPANKEDAALDKKIKSICRGC